MYVESLRTWTSADQLCRDSSRGKARLASIHDQMENNFVKSLFNYKNGLNAWIGGYLNTSERTWARIDGSEWTGLTNWGNEEPNGGVGTPQSIMMYGRTGSEPFKWSDANPLDKINGLLCSHTATTTATTETG